MTSKSSDFNKNYFVEQIMWKNVLLLNMPLKLELISHLVSFTQTLVQEIKNHLK